MRPIAPEIRDKVVELVRAGDLSRNMIARECGVSGAFVSGVAADIGVQFDRSKTELAVKALTIDLAAARGELARQALAEAFTTLDDFHSPVIEAQYQPASEFTEGEWVEYVREEPTISDRRNLATVFGILVQKATDLARVNEGGNIQDGISVLEGLASTLRVAADSMSEVDPTVIPGDDGSTTEKEGA